ncbi:MAG: hypothetical protein HRT35_28700, partial [Algicola sp.]|nr:hypothetical protein [Algicola sp.]
MKYNIVVLLVGFIGLVYYFIGKEQVHQVYLDGLPSKEVVEYTINNLIQSEYYDVKSGGFNYLKLTHLGSDDINQLIHNTGRSYYHYKVALMITGAVLRGQKERDNFILSYLFKDGGGSKRLNTFNDVYLQNGSEVVEQGMINVIKLSNVAIINSFFKHADIGVTHSTRYYLNKEKAEHLSLALLLEIRKKYSGSQLLTNARVVVFL